MYQLKLFFILFLIFSIELIYATETIRLVVWEGYAPEKQRIQFQDYILEKYNVEIKLEVEYISDIEDYYTALRLKKGDILSPTHNLINDLRFRMIELELILPIDLNNIPNLQNINPVFKHADYLLRDGKQYGIPFSYGSYALIYDTKKIKPAPTSWKVLWSEDYRKQLSITDYGEMNIYITGLVLGYKPEEIHDFEKINNKMFKEKLSQLINNTHSFWVGVDTADDLQGLSLATSWGFAIPELKRRERIWKFAKPTEGVLGWADSFVISHSLKNKPLLKRIAEEWINYTISPAYQIEVLVNNLSVHPVNIKTRDLLTEKQIKEFHLDRPNYLKDNFIIIPTLDRRTRNGFNQLWQEALKLNKDETK